MNLRNVDKVKDSLNRFSEDRYRHYFVIERPHWDSQNVYNEIFYVFESEGLTGGFEVCDLISDEELNEYVTEVKSQFNLPVKRWERVLVDYE